MSWANGYIFRKTITVNYTKVPNTDQTDFPVWVMITDGNLKSTTNGGAVTSSSGHDIIFTSDAAGSTLLYWEMESYDATSGTVNAHVKTTLSHTANTVFYMFYGKPGVTTFQSTATSAWNANYKAVWHLKETPAGGSGDFKDSTANGYNSTNTTTQPSATTLGKTSPGAISLNIDGNRGKYLQFNTGALGGTALTIAGWYYVTAYVVDRPLICQRRDNWQLIQQSGSKLQFCMWTSSGQVNYTPTNTFPLTQWFHLAITYNGANVIFYYNGTAIYSPAETKSIYTSATSTSIGWDTYSGYFTGMIDEVRLSSVARSADWIATEYNNQNSPNTFYTVSAEEQNVTSTGAFGPLLLTKETGTAARGGSGTCAKLIPGSTSTTGYWKFYVPTGLYPTVQTFTANGTFTPTTTMDVEYLIVAGGGASGPQGGGGGAGGVLTGTTSVTAQAYSVVVGDGGVGSSVPGTRGTSGSNSSFNGLIAVGGGAGGSQNTVTGLSGGSGGGGSCTGAPSPTGGAPTTGQGYKGGDGQPSAPNYGAGGGGGAGGVGSNGTSTTGGNGGVGILSDISGVSTWYAAGGGGSTYYGGTAGTGGSGIGGNGVSVETGNGTSGAVNTGSGGGGAGVNGTGGNGGKGIVILKYSTSNIAISFYHKISSGFNGSLKVTVYDTDQTTTLLNSQTVTLTDDGNYHQYSSTSLTPSATGLCLVRIEILQGAHSSTDAIYIDDMVIT